MKTTLSILLMLVLAAALTTTASSQLKSQSRADESASTSLVHQGGAGTWGGGLNSFFGLLDPDRFMMRHSFSYNFMSAGGEGLSLASYTNSMFYRISDPLDVRFDVTLQGSPFGPTAGATRNDLNRIYLSRAELNFRPWDNVFFQVEYRQLPYAYYRSPFDPFSYRNPWGDR
jgi:hypothetical protein